ncbi:OVCH1 [Vulpes lagopus]
MCTGKPGSSRARSVGEIQQSVDIRALTTPEERVTFLLTPTQPLRQKAYFVSLKLGEDLFCGGSLIQDDLVVTAAGCLVGLNQKQIKSLTVTAGQDNLSQKVEQEQKNPVSKIIIHPEYSRLGYMSSAMALLYLKHKVEFGTALQPICLPQRDDKFEAGILCMTSGWCKISESKRHQKDIIIALLDFFAHEKQELKKKKEKKRKAGILLAMEETGGPFVCRRDSGIWVLAGISSWRAGWTRDWTSLRKNHRRASLGIFSKVFELMDFITQNICTGKLTFVSKIENSDSSFELAFTAVQKNSEAGICGIPPVSFQWLSRRIINGEEACPHCWPWQVGVRFLGSHHCRGAILSPTWILTAAHCVQSKNNPLFWTIVTGDHDRTLKEPTEQVRRAKHIMVHEDFDRQGCASDIALIQLSSPLGFNSAVRPGCLPQSMELLFSSEICAVTGWGSISEDGGLARHLEQIQVPILEGEVSEHTYSSHPGGLTEKMMCAGFAASGGKDFCQHRCTGPASLQINNESKTLTRQQLPPLTPSTDNAFGPVYTAVAGGCYSEVELEEPRGCFSTPRYPQDYRGKLECSWVLRVSPSSMAKLTVEYLSLPWSLVCPDSVVAIYEESHDERGVSAEKRQESSSSSSILELCQDARNVYEGGIKMVKNQMQIMWERALFNAFHELRTTGESGISFPCATCFGYKLYCLYGPRCPKGSKTAKLLQSSNQEYMATCEDVILTTRRSHSDPKILSQNHNEYCHWKLSAPLNHIVRLDIINFQMKPTPLACQGHMWVYEGFGSGKNLIGKLCGGNSPSLKSYGPLTMLIFTYNVSLAMEEFSLRYSFHISDSMRGKNKVNYKGCPALDLIPVSSTEITSPNYPNIYPNMLNCTWTSYSMSGNKVKAVVKDLTTEESWNCEWDYFSIYDGPDQQSRLLAHLCGSKEEFVLISSGAYLTLNFKTDIHRERCGNTGRGRSRSLQGSLMWYLILEPRDHARSQRQTDTQPLSYAGVPEMNFDDITVESDTGKQPTPDTCGIPVVDPFLMQRSERNTNMLPAERGEPRMVVALAGQCSTKDNVSVEGL